MFCRNSAHAALGTLLAVALVAFTVVPIAYGQQYKKDFMSAQDAAKASDLEAARQMFDEAATGADEAQDAELARQARYIVAQIDYKLGLAAYKAEDFEAALAHHEAGSDAYSNYNKNQYGHGLALKKLGRIDEALVQWKAVSESTGDRKTVLAAERAIREHFYFQASSAVSKTNPIRSDAERAQAALTASQEYLEPDADFHYYMAVVHKILGNAATSVAAADKALEMHKGSRSDKAKIWFTKGEALVSIGDTEAAKLAFQNAAVGAYRQSAEHFLESL